MVLTRLFAPISYGPVQVRVAEALTLLPYLWPEAIAGLWVGVALSNVMGGLGALDVVFGSTATLIAAVLTARMSTVWTAAIPPVVVNAVVVGYYLRFLFDISFAYSAVYVGAGQVVACFLLGVPLTMFLERRLGRR